MNTELLEKYESCTRFDEGAGYKTKEFQEISKRRELLRCLIEETFGEQILPLMEEYTACLYDEMELEAWHYFEQGYRMS